MIEINKEALQEKNDQEQNKQENKNINLQKNENIEQQGQNMQGNAINVVQQEPKDERYPLLNTSLSDEVFLGALRNLAHDPGWASKDYFRPIMVSADRLYSDQLNIKETADELGNILALCLKYVTKRSGKRGTKGTVRKEHCYTVIEEIGKFLYTAPAIYAKAIKTALSSVKYPADLAPVELDAFKAKHALSLSDTVIDGKQAIEDLQKLPAEGLNVKVSELLIQLKSARDAMNTQLPEYPGNAAGKEEYIKQLNIIELHNVEVWSELIVKCDTVTANPNQMDLSAGQINDVRRLRKYAELNSRAFSKAYTLYLREPGDKRVQSPGTVEDLIALYDGQISADEKSSSSPLSFGAELSAEVSQMPGYKKEYDTILNDLVSRIDKDFRKVFIAREKNAKRNMDAQADRDMGLIAKVEEIDETAIVGSISSTIMKYVNGAGNGSIIDFLSEYNKTHNHSLGIPVASLNYLTTLDNLPADQKAFIEKVYKKYIEKIDIYCTALTHSKVVGGSNLSAREDCAYRTADLLGISGLLDRGHDVPVGFNEAPPSAKYTTDCVTQLAMAELFDMVIGNGHRTADSYEVNGFGRKADSIVLRSNKYSFGHIGAKELKEGYKAQDIQNGYERLHETVVYNGLRKFDPDILDAVPASMKQKIVELSKKNTLELQSMFGDALTMEDITQFSDRLTFLAEEIKKNDEKRKEMSEKEQALLNDKEYMALLYQKRIYDKVRAELGEDDGKIETKRVIKEYMTGLSLLTLSGMKSKEEIEIRLEELSSMNIDLIRARSRVGQQMPPKLADVYDKEKLENILSRQDRMVSDLSKLNKKDKKYDGMREAGNLKETESELNEINNILLEYGKKNGTMETDEDVKNLHYKKSLDLAHLIINENSKSDFEELKSLKIDLIKLTMALEKSIDKPLTKEFIDELLGDYAITMKSFEAYLASDKAKSKKEAKRYEFVEQEYLSLYYQTQMLHSYRDDDDVRQHQKSLANLLGMNTRPSGTVVKRVSEEKHLAALDNLPEEAKLVVRVFGTNYKFSESFTGPNIPENKKKAEVEKLMAFKKALTRFKPGTIQVEDMEIYGVKTRLLQTEDNTLYLIHDHEKIRLDKPAALLFDQIERDMFEKTDTVYGKENLKEILEVYADTNRQITSGEHVKMRSYLTLLLSSRLGLDNASFDNIRRTSMAQYALELVNGTKTVDEIKDMIKNATKSENTINGIVLTELLELDAQRRAEIDERVKMYHIENEANENGFTEEEQSVQKLLADLIFSEDTLIMDKNADNPAEYLRTMLSDNATALAILIKQDKGVEDDLIAKVLGRLKLDQIMGEGGNSFASVIADNIRTFAAFMSGITDKSKSVEEIAESIRNELSSKTNNRIEELLPLLSDAMNDSVDKACDALQSNVSKITESIFAETDMVDEDTLDGILKNAARAKNGQGKFTRLLFENYFKGVSRLDRRAMIAAVLRNSRTAEEREYSDEELIRDIKTRRLRKYKEFFKDRDFKKKPLTAAEKTKLDNFRKEKRYLKQCSTWFGGLIKGAGPIFQKIVQGFPEDSLPDEIKLAMKDVKSKLPPIPERVVKTKLNAMVESSKGAVTKIEVVKNLGAATVGQTFKCKIYGPNLPEDGKVVVIKLLRPEVANRMTREESVIMECAKMVDGENQGMHLTFMGQLNNYRAELDLVNEAKNIEEGEIYNKFSKEELENLKKDPKKAEALKNRSKSTFDDVVCEKINPLLSPTVDSLVLEEAPGKTLDDILLETTALRKELKGRFSVKGSMALRLDEYDEAAKWRDKLVDTANDLIKKRDIMKNITHKWVEEALFGTGYYHADLHAGNIMLSDDTGTLIDFGNAVKFTGDQQKSISKMMMGASTGNVDIFFNAFNELLLKKEDKDKTDEDRAFEKFYDEEKRAEVKSVFEEILQMDEDSASKAGQKIGVALIKAQELGIKLPPAIYNFSQGQLRLQKSINDINDMVQSLKEDIQWMDDASAFNLSLDPVGFVQKQIVNTKNMADDDAEYNNAAQFKSYVDQFEPIDKDTFISELLDNTKKNAKLAENIAEVDKRSDFNKKYLTDILGFKEKAKEIQTNDTGRPLTRDMKGHIGMPVYDYADFHRPKRLFSLYKMLVAPDKEAFSVPEELSLKDLDAVVSSFGNTFDKNTKEGKEISARIKELNNIRSEQGYSMIKREDYTTLLEKIRAHIKTLGDRAPINEKAGTALTSKLFGASVADPEYTQFGGATLTLQILDAIAEGNFKEADELIKVFDEDMPMTVRLEEKIIELRNLQDNKRKKSEFNARKNELSEEIYKMYNHLAVKRQARNTISSRFKDSIRNPKDLTKGVKPVMRNLMSIHSPIKISFNGQTIEVADGGSHFEQEFDKYATLAVEKMDTEKNDGSYLPGTTKETIDQLNQQKNYLVAIYTALMQVELKDYYEKHYKRQVEVKFYDFTKVMEDVIRANIKEFVGNVGIATVAKEIKANIWDALAMVGKIAMGKNPYNDDDDNDDDNSDDNDEEEE